MDIREKRKSESPEAEGHSGRQRQDSPESTGTDHVESARAQEELGGVAAALQAQSDIISDVTADLAEGVVVVYPAAGIRDFHLKDHEIDAEFSRNPNIVRVVFERDELRIAFKSNHNMRDKANDVRKILDNYGGKERFKIGFKAAANYTKTLLKKNAVRYLSRYYGTCAHLTWLR